LVGAEAGARQRLEPAEAHAAFMASHQVIWWRRCAARGGPTSRFAHGGPPESFVLRGLRHATAARRLVFVTPRSIAAARRARLKL